MLVAADEKLTPGHGWGCYDGFSYVVLGQQLEFPAGFHDRDTSFRVSEVDLVVPRQERGMELAVEALAPNRLAGLRIKAIGNAGVFDIVIQPLVTDRRRNVGRPRLHFPGEMGLRQVAALGI